jgi:hypothetical protein
MPEIARKKVDFPEPEGAGQKHRFVGGKPQSNAFDNAIAMGNGGPEVQEAADAVQPALT